MKRLSLTTVLAVVLLVVPPVETHAQEAAGREGQIVLPWEEFKRALRLDEEKIVLPMDTFQKLLAQTGAAVTPAHTVSGGNVVLSREEFTKLVNRMQPHAGPGMRPPVSFLVTKAIYSGKMTEATTAFTGTFTVHVLARDTYLKIPVLPESVAMEDIRVDGEEALVVSENGFYNVVLTEAGEYTVEASFSLKSALDKGPHKLDLFVKPTPITLLELEIPLANISVKIPNAQQIRTDGEGNSTFVRAVISRGNHIGIQWQRRIPAAEKVPPKLYSELYHLVSIEDDVQKITSEIHYTILHSEIDEVLLTVPEGMNILSVTGEGVGEWQETEQEGQRLLRVPFLYGKKGRAAMVVTAETPLTESGTGNSFSGLRTLGVVRETGFVGIALNTSAELVVSEVEVLEKVAPRKLPAQLINRSAKPLMLGFKYLKHPYHIVFEVKRHEKISVPVAAVDSASVVTLFTEDGKVVHRMVYQVRNSARQFLGVQLPEGADVWGVFVDSRPVESSISGGERKLLVPLIRSRAANNQLATFPVEVILALSGERFSWSGTRGSRLPAVDLLTSQLIWSVYLPNDYGYNYFSSTLEKEEIIRGLNIFSQVQRSYDRRAVLSGSETAGPADVDELKKVYKGKEARSRFRNIPMEEAVQEGQMKAELEFNDRLGYLARQDAPQSVDTGAGGAAGVLPIMIKVPTSGQVYRFARTVIRPEDPLTFSVVYTQLWLGRLARWAVLLGVILVLYAGRHRLRGPWERLKKCQGTLEKISGSALTPFVLLGLAVLSWPFAPPATLLLLFLLWVSAAHNLLNLFRKRGERKRREQLSNRQAGEGR